MPSLCYLCLGGPGDIRVTGYNINLCNRCYTASAKGFAKQHEKALFDALGRAGLLIPDRNEQGLLPREYEPPADYAL